jgi:hypothetical protein
MNIHIRLSDFVFVLGLALSLTACKPKSDAPTAPISAKIEIDTTLVRYDSLGSIGGPGFYYKTCPQEGEFNPYSGDSVVKMLLDSNFSVQEFWYPETPDRCADPINHELEIVKLNQPDTTIFRLAFTSLDSGYSDACIEFWRHYTIRKVTGGT